MKIVFMGTPDFAVPSLQALIDNGYDVIGVYTQPDRPKGRGKKLQPSPVKEVALQHNIPVYQPEKIRKESVAELQALAPDLYVTAAFGQILSQELLDIPKFGCINVHASLLPRHRGSAPIAWGMLQGDAEAGVTTMMTDVGIDTGDMLLKAATPIREDETCAELTERLSRLGADLLVQTLQALEAGTLQRLPQDEAAMTYDPKLTKDMSPVCWEQESLLVARQINGLHPWPSCTCIVGGETLKLLRAKPVTGSGVPGEVLQADPKQGLTVACGAQAVEILQLRAPGGKAMLAKDYLRGHPVAVGTIWKEEQNG